MTTATLKATPLNRQAFPLRNHTGSCRVGTVGHPRGSGRFDASELARPRIIVTSLPPLPMETAPAGTWQRVVHLLRLGMLVIAMAGLVKASGAFTQAAAFVMLLLDYLTH